MISWLYSMVELFRGKLPWHAATDAEKVLKAKMTTDRNRLIMGKEMYCPQEMLTVYDKIMGLEFADEPAYTTIISFLKESLRSRFGLGPNDFAWDAFYRTETKQDVSAEANETPPAPA
jgi:hypothetical protein